MIIKCLSRKKGIRQIVRYVFRDAAMPVEKKRGKRLFNEYGMFLTQRELRYLLEEKEDARLLHEFEKFHERTGSRSYKAFIDAMMKDLGQPFIIRKNLRGRSLDAMIAELEKNEERRISKRKDAVAVQHVIISWKPEDAARLNDTILYDIANKFCALRGKGIPMLGTKHEHGVEHTHLHILVAGTALDGRSSRISKDRLASIKRQLQEYQKERYPFLESLPEHGKKQRMIERGEEVIEKIYKNGRRTDSKQRLFAVLDGALASSKTLDQFYDRLERSGVATYSRSGSDTITGLTFEGLKFRYSRLGISERVAELEQRHEREEKELAGLAELRAGKRRSLEVAPTIFNKETLKREAISDDPEQWLLEELRAMRAGTSRDREAYDDREMLEAPDVTDADDDQEEGDNTNTWEGNTDDENDVEEDETEDESDDEDDNDENDDEEL